MAQVILYELGPHDHWGGWIDLEKFKAGDYADDYMGTESENLEKQVSEFLDAAKKLALSHGWEGDMRQGPFMTAIPNDHNDIYIAVAWKQDNNGVTYIASPIELPHLGTPKARLRR